MDLLVPKSMLLGGLILGCLVASLFFLRFFKMTRDKLFLYVSLSFLTLAVSHVLLAIGTISSEEDPAVYLVRLVAYGLIIFAIVDKNLKKYHSSKGRPTSHTSLSREMK
ncbi:MAG: DUF5985 family protein [Nitrospiraceae bacterium]